MVFIEKHTNNLPSKNKYNKLQNNSGRNVIFVSLTGMPYLSISNNQYNDDSLNNNKEVN